MKNPKISIVEFEKMFNDEVKRYLIETQEHKYADKNIDAIIINCICHCYINIDADKSLISKFLKIIIKQHSLLNMCNWKEI